MTEPERGDDNIIILKSDLARMLQVSTRTIERRVRARLLPRPEPHSKPARWRRKLLIDFLKANGIDYVGADKKSPTQRRR